MQSGTQKYMHCLYALLPAGNKDNQQWLDHRVYPNGPVNPYPTSQCSPTLLTITLGYRVTLPTTAGQSTCCQQHPR